MKEFAANEYTLALMQGSALPEEEYEQIAAKLARYTGLSKEYIVNTDLRINIFRFCKELLRDEHLTVGRLDSRFTGVDRDSAGETFERDPSNAAILGPYAATFNHYVRQDLEFETTLPYQILAPLYQKWKFGDKNQYLNVAETLRQAIATNPNLKVFVANGFYDFATPFFATEYTFNHLGLPKSYLENVSMGYYEAGHMMYLHIPSLEKVTQDLSDFIDSASA